MRTERVKFDRTQQLFWLLGLVNVSEVTLLLIEIGCSLICGALVLWMEIMASVCARIGCAYLRDNALDATFLRHHLSC